MKQRIKYPSVGAFNVGRGSILGLHPQTTVKNSSQIKFIKLTVWEKLNNRSRDESRRLIRQNILLATKYKGVWWVKVNPLCEDSIADL